MTLCPIAVIASCKQCPAVNFCPLKTVLGDAKSDTSTDTEGKSKPPNSNS